jgi:hypothetical protein
LNLSLANEYLGDVTIPTQVIENSQNFLQADQPIRLPYSNQIKLFEIKKIVVEISFLKQTPAYSKHKSWLQ